MPIPMRKSANMICKTSPFKLFAKMALPKLTIAPVIASFQVCLYAMR